MDDTLKDKLDISPVKRTQTIFGRSLAQFHRYRDAQSRLTRVRSKFLKRLQQLASHIKEDFATGIIRIRDKINFTFH